MSRRVVVYLYTQTGQLREVAEAFVYLAHAEKTTAAVITVDGGNIEAALR